MAMASIDDVAELFRRITCGVYVIGVAHGTARNAFTAAWLVQASFEPLIVALSVNPAHASYPLLKRGRGFTVSVLAAEQLDLARHFGTRSGRAVDKLAGIAWRPGRTGAPILTDAPAWFDCRLEGSLTAGDHELVLGRVVDGALEVATAAPLAYRDTGDLDGSRELYPGAL
jgi:flavin reductase (DIM6/NTAB) family NADH-FMN oxidoreductase RutF